MKEQTFIIKLDCCSSILYIINYNSLESRKPGDNSIVDRVPLQPPSTTKPYLASSATSTSTLAVIGAFECPAVGSSVFSSPLVELTTCKKNTEQKEL